MSEEFKLESPEQISRHAKFDPARLYRYTLQIVWDNKKPLYQFIGLNPSTADELKDDPTMTAIQEFVRRWEGGGVIMTNLFAYRTKDPDIMKIYPEPIGRENDHWIDWARETCITTVAAWGNHGAFKERADIVTARIPGMKCLKLTKNGQPWHPLYVARTTPLIPFN